MNKVILSGRLTATPTKALSKNLECTSFAIAVKRDKGVEYFNCVAYGQLAKYTNEHFRKGDCIILVGKLHINEYTNKLGQKLRVTVIYCESIEYATGYDKKLTFEDYRNFEDSNVGGINVDQETTNEDLPFKED